MKGVRHKLVLKYDKLDPCERQRVGLGTDFAIVLGSAAA
jgi:hypothetical protein